MGFLKKTWRRYRGLSGKWQAIIAAVLILVIAVASSGSAKDDKTTVASSKDTTSTTAAPTTTTSRVTTTTAPAAPSFKDGKHRVGADIQPGIYRNANVGEGCYWARLKGFGGGMNDLLANDNASGSAVVEILPTDAGFESTRCGTWRMDTSQVTKSKTTFGEGTFITNTDFEPGQWRNSGGDGCYWARLRNFQGGINSLIANENVDGQTIVDIAGTDTGFTSTRCGTWTKIG